MARVSTALSMSRPLATPTTVLPSSTSTAPAMRPSKLSNTGASFTARSTMETWRVAWRPLASVAPRFSVKVPLASATPW